MIRTGRFSFFHYPDLERRGLRPQHHFFGDVESVLHVPGRMVFRDVQRLEIVIVQLDLRPFDRFEPEPIENAANFHRRLCDRMQATRQAGSLPGIGYVDRFTPDGLKVAAPASAPPKKFPPAAI